jgi:hypothetical protein
MTWKAWLGAHPVSAKTEEALVEVIRDHETWLMSAQRQNA